MDPTPALVAVSDSRWLARFVKFVVLMLFVLIMIGGHTTTSGAGMAFPDWPLSSGSINPDGWWEDMMQRLEHGHRLMAETVALLIGILCAWVWQSKWSIPLAIGVSVALAITAKLLGAEPAVIAHTGLWSAAVTFALVILSKANSPGLARSPVVRWIAFAAFLGVLAQAIMGGLRVTIESGGNPGLAIAFRVAHGTFAHLELSMVVALAAMLSPVWPTLSSMIGGKSVSVLAWITAGFLLAQLVVGATMRHLGAGLAISSWPHATPEGGLLPAVHNRFVDLNFTHTRVGAVIVSLLILALALRAIGHACGEVRIIRPAALLIALVTAQFTLGVLVIWKLRPPVLTTLHVVNGAALLATTVLLAVRAGRAGRLLTAPRADRSTTSSEVTA